MKALLLILSATGAACTAAAWLVELALAAFRL